MEYRSLADLRRDIVAWLPRLPPFDAVVGIPRSGMIPAVLLGLYRNVPVFASGQDGLCLSATGFRSPTRLIPARILVVDDSVLSGRTMGEARTWATSRWSGATVLCGAVYLAPGSEQHVDVFYQCLPGPRIFEWNLFHCDNTARIATDLDGVLCRDPTPEENDDGEKYRAFLETVDPAVVPTYPVGAVITCRLEKYRAQTEAWLKKWNIRYGALLMWNLPTRAARMECGHYGTQKGRAFAGTDLDLMAESTEPEAIEIARVSGRPVVHFATGTLIHA